MQPTRELLPRMRVVEEQQPAMLKYSLKPQIWEEGGHVTEDARETVRWGSFYRVGNLEGRIKLKFCRLIEGKGGGRCT